MGTVVETSDARTVLTEVSVKMLQDQGLLHTADFLTLIAGTNLQEMGSGSVNGKYRESLKQVRRLMLETYNIHTKNNAMHESWERGGDPDTFFYLGGWKASADSPRVWVTPEEYLCLLARVAGELSAEARETLEGLLETFAASMRRLEIIKREGKVAP